MISYFLTTTLIVTGLLLTAAVAIILNRFWPLEARSRCTDSISSHLNVLGTTYAVILGFMIFNVWSEFRTASVGVTAEAAAVLDIARASEGLPKASGSRVRQLARFYAQEVQGPEWHAMRTSNAGRLPEDGDKILMQIDRLNGDPSISTTVIGDQLRSALDHLHEQRRLREERFRNDMPTGLWVLLLSGAALVIFSACLVGGHSTALYYTQVLSLSFVILVTLATIADIDHPFAGSVTVSSAPFHDVILLMAL